jgi:hypothetical protein
MAFWEPRRTHDVDKYPYMTHNQIRNWAENNMNYNFKYVLNGLIGLFIGMRCQTLSPLSIPETGKPHAIQLAISDFV